MLTAHAVELTRFTLFSKAHVALRCVALPPSPSYQPASQPVSEARESYVTRPCLGTRKEPSRQVAARKQGHFATTGPTAATPCCCCCCCCSNNVPIQRGPPHATSRTDPLSRNPPPTAQSCSNDNFHGRGCASRFATGCARTTCPDLTGIARQQLFQGRKI